jgi:cell wall-associated NlpC family hydrolase
VSLDVLILRRAPIPVVVALLATLAAATPGSGAPPRLKQKEAQAREVLAEVNALDLQLNRVGEQLNGAQYDLGKARARERVTLRQLKAARTQFRLAQHRVAQRLVALYESNSPTTADAVLGATSLSSILDRLQLVTAADKLDQGIAHNAQVRRDQLAARETEFASERVKAAAAVAAIAVHRQTISVELGQRQQLLSSVQGEVRKLQAQEAARQARLAAEARARLAAEQRARAAAARAAAARAAQARKRKAAAPPAAPPPTTTTATTTTAPMPTTTTAPPASTTTDSTPATTTTAPAPPPPPPAPTAAGHPAAAAIALKYLGVPYVFGGGTPAGFDCSGLVMYVFAQLGVQLPHYAAAQYGFGVPVPRADLQPVDLVFFDALGHVGIYIGGNQFVHAPQTGDVVKISSLTGWYAANYVGARRI